MVAGLDPDIEFEYHCNVFPDVNDTLMGQLPPASLVINATGMGKDLPGSPITDGGLFPIGGVAWELNYRGELQFLRQALAQRFYIHTFQTLANIIQAQSLAAE